MPALTNEAVLATIPLTWTKIQKTPIFCTVVAILIGSLIILKMDVASRFWS